MNTRELAARVDAQLAGDGYTYGLLSATAEAWCEFDPWTWLAEIDRAEAEVVTIPDIVIEDLR